MPLHNPAAAVADLLAAAGLNLTLKRNLFAGPVRETGARVPTAAVFCTNAGGVAPAPYQGDTGDFHRGAVQVTVRGVPTGWDAGEELARRCLAACQRKRPSGYVTMLVQQSSPEYAGEDEGGRPEWVFRVEAWWSTAAP